MSLLPNSLVSRLVMLFATSLLVVAMVISWLYFDSYNKMVTDAILKNVQQSLRTNTLDMEKMVFAEVNRLELIGASKPIEQVRIATTDELDFNRKDLEAFIARIMKSYPVYYQVRVTLDKSYGQAPIIFGGNGNDLYLGRPTNLNRQHYMDDIKGLQEGDFFSSQIHLSRNELGQVLEPKIPLIYFSIPIINSSGSVVGALTSYLKVNVIFNLYRSRVNKLLPNLEGAKFYIANENGEFLMHPQKIKEMQFEFSNISDSSNTIENVSSLWPQSINFSRDMSYLNGVHSIVDKDNLLMIESINIGSDVAPNFHYFYLSVPVKSIFGSIYKEQQYLVIVILVFILLLLFFCGLFMYFQLKPLRVVAQRMIEYNPNKPLSRLPENTVKEISSVARSFNKMGATLREKYQFEYRLKEALSTQLAVVEWDSKFKIVDINDICLNIMGWTKQDVIGQGIDVMTTGNHATEYYKSILMALVAGKIWQGDIRHMTSSGNTVWFATISVPFLDDDGKLIQVLVIQSDVTKQKNLIEAVKEERNKAEHASRVKSDFIASMSHELRTPLNSIIGFSRRLKSKLDVSVGERNIEAVAVIERNGHHLLQLVNEILDVAKIEAGKMELLPSRFDLSELLRESIITLTPQAQAKGLSIQQDFSDEICSVFLDRKKIVQVVLNLLANAIKYTQKGSITITLLTTTDSIKISVIDTGIGITEDNISKLFARFSQVIDENSNWIEGTGLGLVLVEELVELHKGSIKVESVYGQGSVFTVTLPRSLNLKKPIE